MSALRHSNLESSYESGFPQNRQCRPIKPNYCPKPTSKTSPVVRELQPNLSPPLKSLAQWQKFSSILALLSTTVTIGLYIASVEVPEKWTKEQTVLEELQRQERRLTEFNESLKYQLGEDAEKSQIDLLPPQSKQNIFLPKISHNIVPVRSTKAKIKQESTLASPLGY
ncbi:MAG: hypothetical protein D6756_12595 [Cyanobacteria bacterium J083]|nr:MAG: hypothetical protein D6756_12595 [Cyanobacteria bacterium J083]